ncbi:MAG: response regulator transcription factor [Anaerolineales bacterium]|nr:response regulator transcription factor [Anaerolineales bacterium]
MPIKILVIDDDTAITELLSMLLKTHGFEVITTNSGREGIQLAMDETPNVVLLDLMMPDKDGWEVSKAVRKFSNVPIVILSAINDPSMIASILDAGADDYLIKPVPSAMLVAHIKKLMRRTTDSLKEFAGDSASFVSETHPLIS